MLSADVKYWINCIDTYNLIEKCDRPVLIWGAYSKACSLCDEFEKRSIQVNGYIDGHKNISEYQGKPVYKPRDILPRKTCYIVVAIEGVRNEIKEYLKDYGYRKDEDYFYFSEHTPDIKLSGLMGEYCDIYNNRFVYEGEGGINVNIHCIGGGNTIIFGKNFDGGENLSILLSFGGTIELGEGFISRGYVTLDASMGGQIIVGKGFNLMTNTNINAKYDAKIKIGDYVTSGERLFLTSGKNSKVTIGSDCMFSHDVSILGTNGHSILDLENCVNHSKLTEKPIVIGNHVWLGKGSSILYETKIGDGSIVGMQSMVKGVYPSCSVIVGNIARVIRENCTWDRRREIEFYER